MSADDFNVSIPTPEERAANHREIEAIPIANRFQRMFGHREQERERATCKDSLQVERAAAESERRGLTIGDPYAICAFCETEWRDDLLIIIDAGVLGHRSICSDCIASFGDQDIQFPKVVFLSEE